LNENNFIRITDWCFDSESQIVPKFTYLLTRDGIKWDIRTKYYNSKRKIKLALFREPFEPILKP